MIRFVSMRRTSIKANYECEKSENDSFFKIVLFLSITVFKKRYEENLAKPNEIGIFAKDF